MVVSRLPIVGFAAAVLAGGAVFPASANADPSVRVVRVPAGGICPRAAVDGRGVLQLVYFKGDARHGDLFRTHSDDGGQTFAAAERVNSQRGTVMVVGSVRGPQLAVGRGGRLFVTWSGKGPTAGEPLAMWFARSADAGGFQPQRDATGDHPGVDGGGAVAADPSGNVYLAWHAPDGSPGEANRRVWLARSTDDGATFAPAAPISPAGPGCCGCCGLAIAAGRRRPRRRRLPDGRRGRPP